MVYQIYERYVLHVSLVPLSVFVGDLSIVYQSWQEDCHLHNVG